MGQVGRPSKLTDEVREKLLSAIRVGNFATIAARYAGISEATFYRWMERGKQARSGQYREFREAVLEAEVEGEVSLVTEIKRAATSNPSAARFILQQRHPSRWRRKEGEEERRKAVDERDRRRMTDEARIEEAHAALDLARQSKEPEPIAKGPAEAEAEAAA